MATPTGVTGSGNTIVGDALSQYGNGFVIWNSTAGSTFVPAPPVAHPAGLFTGAISRDGAVVVGSVGLGTNRQGHDTRRPFRWHTSAGRYELLDHPSPTCYACDVSVVSDDGSAMCGERFDYALNGGLRTPYRWTSSSGFTDLAILPELGSGDYYTTGIDGAGSIVVGFFYNGPSSVGVIWDERGAIHRAESYFAELGLELPGWVIFSLRDVSADGRFYSGMGIRPPAQMLTAFIIDLGPDCDSDGIRDHIEISQGAADFNRNDIPDTCECIADLFRNGSIDGADLAIMLSQWGPASESTVSDLNGDGSVGGVDLAALLASWGSCTN